MQSVERLAELRWCRDDEGLEGDEGLAPRLDRGVLGDLDLADHLDLAVGRPGRGGGPAGQDGAGGVLGVEGIALAVHAPITPVGSVDLDHPVTPATQVAGDARAIRGGALDAEGEDVSMARRPAFQLLGADPVGGHGQLAEPAAQLIEGDRDVDVLVRVDTDNDPSHAVLLRDAIHGCRPLAWARSTRTGRADRTVMGPGGSGSYAVTARSASAPMVRHRGDRQVNSQDTSGQS